MLKGIGGVMPGQHVKPSQTIQKIIHDIKNRKPYIDEGRQNGRNGRNQFIDIVDFFRKHFN